MNSEIQASIGSPISVFIQLGNCRNPDSTSATNTFKIETLSADGNVIEGKYDGILL